MKKTVSNVLKHLVCISLCIVVILPFYMVFINSLKPKAEAARMSLALPTEWHFETYLEVIEEANLVHGFFNSLTYAGISTTIGVLGCAMAAFVMARNKTKINNFLYYFVICGLFFPINYVTLVKVLQTFNLANTKPGIIIAFISSMIPFCIFTIRNLFLRSRWSWTKLRS